MAKKQSYIVLKEIKLDVGDNGVLYLEGHANEEGYEVYVKDGVCNETRRWVIGE